MFRDPCEARKQDVEDIMEWLRNPEDDSLDPMGDFKKVDQLRPKKACQKPKDRAEEIHGALDWMRNKGVKPFNKALGLALDWNLLLDLY